MIMKRLSAVILVLVLSAGAIETITGGATDRKEAIAQIVSIPSRFGVKARIRMDNHLPDRPVTGINLGLTDAADADLRLLMPFSNLRSLGLAFTRVTDKGMLFIKRFAELEEIDLKGTMVTDDSLPTIATLMDVKRLFLTETSVTGAGLSHIAKMKKLEVLKLSGPTITDTSLRPLQGVTTLRSLALVETQITGSGLGYLRDLGGLADLSLEMSTRFGDAHVSELRWFPNLISLDVQSTAISDKGLGEILRLKARLKEINLMDTGISDRGLYRLRGVPSLEVLKCFISMEQTPRMTRSIDCVALYPRHGSTDTRRIVGCIGTTTSTKTVL